MSEKAQSRRKDRVRNLPEPQHALKNSLFMGPRAYWTLWTSLERILIRMWCLFVQSIVEFD